MIEIVLNEKNRAKIEALDNHHVKEIVEKYIDLCKPSKVTVLTDSEEDQAYIRQLAIDNKEEKPLKTEGHTIHYDNYYDQARDKKNTFVLLPDEKNLSKRISTIGKEEGLKEIFSLMDGIMEGKEMLVCFYTLGPQDSMFTIPCLQMNGDALHF